MFIKHKTRSKVISTILAALPGSGRRADEVGERPAPHGPPPPLPHLPRARLRRPRERLRAPQRRRLRRRHEEVSRHS